MGKEEIPTAAPNSDLRERVIFVINEFCGGWRKYPYLEERTGISARKWQNVCNRVQQPSVEMIAKLAEVRPHFLSYMVTGDAINSLQVNPEREDWQNSLFNEHVRVLSLLQEKLGVNMKDTKKDDD